MGRNQYWAGRVYDLCVYYMTGTPEGSTESGFMEKPGIEPATPGLQGIALTHYTTGASQIIKPGVFSLVGNYLRPSNNYRQSIFNINAVVLILINCKDLRNW